MLKDPKCLHGKKCKIALSKHDTDAIKSHCEAHSTDITHEFAGNTLQSRAAYQVHYGYRYIGENITRVHHPRAKDLFDQWTSDKEDNQNLLGPYTEFGLACERSPFKPGFGEFVCVAVFGSPQ